MSETTDEADDYPVALGDVVDGRFRVERFVGMGAMGVVVEAKHTELGERVAIKFLRRSARKNEDAVLRFAREARAAARLKSEHVARVLDVGEMPDGTPYMVMEYLSGANLDEYLLTNGPFRDVDKAVLAVIQICEAVAEAHALGIVHRDIKPANLFILRDDGAYPRVKLLDFGISKAALTGEYTNIELDSTKTSAIMGSPYYMAPEQVRSTRDVDARADLWSLGAVLFELLTGKPIWRSEELGQLVSEIIAFEPRKLREFLPTVDEAFEKVVESALTKDPAERVQSAADFARALAPFAPAGRAALHVDRAQSFRDQGVSSRSLPSLRTSSRDINASARPGRTTNSRLPDAPQRSSSSVSIALGIAVIALLGIVTALVLRRVSAPVAGEPVPSATAALISAAAAPPTPPPGTAASAPVAAAAQSPSSPPVAAAAGHAPAPWRPATRGPAVAPPPPPPRAGKASASPPAAEPAPPKPAPTGIDSDPYRRAQPKLEDNPFK